jgi:hypothetical protein
MLFFKASILYLNSSTTLHVITKYHHVSESTRVHIKHRIMIENNFNCNYWLQVVQVTCVGEGPVVHVTPTHIDYGTISVLNDVTKIVRMSNESLIPAQFSCAMVRLYLKLLFVITSRMRP